MAFDKCIKELTAVASKAFGALEARELFAKLERTKAQMDGMTADKKLQGYREAAAEFAEQSLMQAHYNKLRQAQFNLCYQSFKDHMKNFTNPGQGIVAWLAGAENVKFNVHGSVEAYVKGARREVVQRFLGEVDALKTVDGSPTVFELGKSGELDLPLAENLMALTDKRVEVSKVNPVVDNAARQLAGVCKKYQNMGMEQLRLRGVNIRDLEGRITRQMHNPQEMQRMGKDAWMDLAKKTFHTDTFSDMKGFERTYKDMLSSMYDAVTSGIRSSYQGETGEAFKKYSGNLAQQLSSERLVKFKDAKSFLEYREAMKQPGSLLDDITKEVDTNFKNAAMMDRMSHDPHGFFERIKEDTLLANRTRDDVGSLKATLSDNGYATRIFKNLSGFLSQDLNPSMSSKFDSIRTFHALNTQLLSAVKSIPDLSAGVQQLSLWGQDSFTSLGQFAEGWTRQFGAKGSDAHMEANRASYFLAEEYFMGLHSDWRDNNNVGGLNRKIMSTIYKYNGQELWDTVSKYAIGNAVSRLMGHMATKPLNEITNKMFSQSLFKYGVDSDMWNVLRQGVYKATDSGEHNYVTADAVRALPDSVFKDYMAKKGMEVTDYSLNRTKNELTNKVSTIFDDSGNHMITLAGAKEQALMNPGSWQRGTFSRGMSDLVFQFKGYMLANANRTWASTVYGRGAESMMDALRNKNGELPAIARNVALGFMFWYLSDAAKSAILGQTPRTWGGDNSAQANLKNTLVALAGSGGLGPYSELLTNDFGADKSALAETALGPTVGRIGQAASLFWKSTFDQMGGDIEGKTPKFPAVQDVRFLQENTPFMSAPVVKAAVNYLVLYDLENYLDPKANERREKLIKQDTGQSYFYPPSQSSGIMNLSEQQQQP